MTYPMIEGHDLELEDLVFQIGPDLSPRQAEVVVFILRGYRIKEIARELCVCSHTVKNHCTAINKILGTSDQRDLLVLALHHLLNS